MPAGRSQTLVEALARQSCLRLGRRPTQLVHPAAMP